MKSFEDYFSELQADLVKLCLDFVENRADDIYIYCSYEPEAYNFDVFYKINGKFSRKHKINEVVMHGHSQEHTYDLSRERQIGLMNIVLENLEAIHARCKEYGREMPTEMKLHYHVKSNSLNADYKYDLIYSNDDELLPSDIFEKWFNEVSRA